MNVTVFCGSAPGNEPIYTKSAADLGKWIAENGYSLVYGGGDAGLMGIVAAAAKENGAYVIGVVPGDVAFIRDRAHPYCDRVIISPDMDSRKRTMMDMAGMFVALPGGCGTLDEITEVITLTKLRKYNSPAVFFNVAGYYEPLKEFFCGMEKNGFSDGSEREWLLFSDDLDEIKRFMD